jgi:hypothetical protein
MVIDYVYWQGFPVGSGGSDGNSWLIRFIHSVDLRKARLMRSSLHCASQISIAKWSEKRAMKMAAGGDFAVNREPGSSAIRSDMKHEGYWECALSRR